jgi:uncharacterized glyoxalase superfamily protein PhnB
MDIKYRTALLFVKDVALSRAFYEKYLHQTVEYDFGENVSFHGGFAIHDAEHISHLLFDRPNPYTDGKLGKENFELYFECEELDRVFDNLAEYGVTFVHPLREQPWGQRVCRFYDPDGHIVEVGEPMAAVIRRYLKEGKTAPEVAERTSMPLAEVLQIQSETGDKE